MREGIQIKYLYSRLGMHRLLYFVFILFWFSSATARQVSFWQYQVESGLSNNWVNCILQDRKGFVWIGTQDGLNRFDGYSFKVFRNISPGVSNNNIHSLCTGADNKLWAGTESGLFQFDHETERFELIRKGSPGLVGAMHLDRHGLLWFVQDYQLHVLNTKTQKIRSYPPEKYFKATSLCAVGDQLWVSSADGSIERYLPGTDSFKRFQVLEEGKVADKNRWIDHIYATAEGDILIGTATHGAKLFHAKSGRFSDVLAQHKNGSSVFVKAFVQVSKNEYWIGTESSGIYLFDKGTGAVSQITKRYNDPYALSDNSVNSFYKDTEGGIWTGTSYGGVNYHAKRKNFFEKFYPGQKENSLKGNVIRGIQQDDYGNLWIGTEDAGLNKMERSSGKFTSIQPYGSSGGQPNANTNIYSMLIDGDQLWIGTYVHGLDVMDIKTGKTIRHYGMRRGSASSLQSDIINCIYKAPNQQIYICTARGLYRFNRESNNFSLANTNLTWYTCAFQDKGGTLWAGTLKAGLKAIDVRSGLSRSYQFNFNKTGSIGKGRVNSIFGDSKGRLWVGTAGGLCLFNEKTNAFSCFSTATGLPSNIILSILEDKKGNLWLATSLGLVCFDPETRISKVYKKNSGLLSDQFNYNSAFQDKNGRMYFGSLRGLISFNPDSLQRTLSSKLPLYITGFEINNEEPPIGMEGSPLSKSITWTDEIELKHHQSSFSIDFAALNFISPETIEYAYMMDGLDKSWTYLKVNRKVYFTSIAPGTYHFRVKAFSPDDQENASERVLTIRILPPWWLNPAAYFLYASITVALIIFILRRYRHSVEQRNKRKMEQLEIARTKELYEDKLNFFTNVAHEIKTPLTLIKGPLESLIQTTEDPDVAGSLMMMNRNTNRLIELTNQFLDFRQTEIQGYSLNLVNENISSLLQETFEAFKPMIRGRDLEYSLRLPAESVFANIDSDGFNKIVSNLFSNAIKYANRKIIVELFAKDESGIVRIDFSNDGFLIPEEMAQRIFEPFVRLRETKKRAGTGIGLSLALSLAKLHKGTVELIKSCPEMNTFSLKIPAGNAWTLEEYNK